MLQNLLFQTQAHHFLEEVESNTKQLSVLTGVADSENLYSVRPLIQEGI